MKIIGVTGALGSGKSSSAQIFSELGAYLVDHDKINHELLQKGRAGYNALIKEYGSGIAGEDGEILRAKLAEIAFSSSESVKRIEKILHPIITKVEEEQVRNFKEEGKYEFIVFDTPLLFETKKDELCDYVVVITADEDKLYERAKKKFGFDKEQVKKRTSLQMPLSEKAARADYVIDNGGSIEELKEKVKRVFEKIKGR